MSTNTFITKSDYLAFLESPRHLGTLAMVKLFEFFQNVMRSKESGVKS
jgi:hypothetical protein